MGCRGQGRQNVGTLRKRVCWAFLRVRRVEGGARRIGTSYGRAVEPSKVYLRDELRI
jgi:hypothetical protein